MNQPTQTAADQPTFESICEMINKTMPMSPELSDIKQAISKYGLSKWMEGQRSTIDVYAPKKINSAA